MPTTGYGGKPKRSGVPRALALRSTKSANRAVTSGAVGMPCSSSSVVA
ncbi:MAG TPA: hypothetical protein VLW83_01170 [Candidatus Acidoferrales bacterium]|nr:hypothetical protein [Candidatus Acidoferrales bacterium]